MVLAVSGVSAVGAINSRYEVLSIYGNPKSTKPVEAVDSNSSQSSSLISVAPKISDEIVQKQDLQPVRQVAGSGYADIMKAQDIIFNDADNVSIDSSEFGKYLFNIKEKMIEGVSNNIPRADILKDNEPNVRAVSGNESSDYLRNIDDMQHADQTKAYNINKMISAYETTMMFAV